MDSQPLILAQTLIKEIESSGSTYNLVLAASGVVYDLLPTLSLKAATDVVGAAVVASAKDS
jgi:hypothetical protein